MTFPLNSLMTGDELGRKQMGVALTLEDHVRDLKGFLGWRPVYKFGVCHNGRYLFAHPDAINDFLDVLVRVMLWNVKSGVGVFYFACSFGSAPYELEGLVAVNLKNAPTSRNQNAGGYSSSSIETNNNSTTGSRKQCFTCRGLGRVTCNVCGGSGGKNETVSSTNYAGTGGSRYSQVWHSCFKCNGTGRVDCPDCGGRGYTTR